MAEFKPKILGFLCNWCSYAGADLAGVSRQQYPSSMKVIRVMCSGRVDLAFVLRAFANGNDGVFIGGCWLGDCHYVTEGNYDALSVMHLGKKLLEYSGLNPDRLRLEWVSASEGLRYAEVVTEFTDELKELGPLGESEGVNQKELKIKIEAIAKLLPYIKLVEREKLRVRFENKEDYEEFFSSDEITSLINDMIADKLAISQIMVLLQEEALSSREIAASLSMNSSDVSKHLSNSARQKLIKFDESEQLYALAGLDPKSLHPFKGNMDIEKIEQIIKDHNGEASSLIQIMLDIQKELHWLPHEALEMVSEKLQVPMSRIQHTATFYKAFSLVPKGRHEINLCMGTACHVRGAPRVLEVLQNTTGLEPGETDPDMKFSLDTVNCLGCCALGPVMEIDEQHLGRLDSGSAADLLKNYD